MESLVLEKLEAGFFEREEQFPHVSLFEEAPVALHEADRNGIVLRVNRAHCSLLGLEPSDILGRPIWDFVAPEQREASRQALLRRICGQDPPAPVGYEFIRPDGARRTLEVQETLIRNAEGEVVRIVTALSDITSRDRLEPEGAVRASERRYRELFENANDIIYTLDLDGNLTSLNKAGERITGYTREEALGMNIAEMLLPEYRELAGRMMERKLAGEAKTTCEVEIAAKDGRRVPLEVSTQLIYENGKPVGLQSIARDVTERKQLENQLRQSQKMEAVGQLAGGIAHDFNNLLTVVMGYSDLLCERLRSDPSLHRAADEIRKAADRAASLTRQLLAFSRKQVLRPKVVDLDDIVSGMDRMLRRLIGEDIDLVTVRRNALEPVKADPGQIEQVIMNLAVNARDAMPRGGKLTIETANVELQEGHAGPGVTIEPGPYVMLAISDTGCGMDAETQSRIFEPFFTTKEVGKGTGLGLSTVYGIVKQSGGYVWVESEPGHGATFRIYLPRLPEVCDPAEPPQTAALPLLGSETILVADDEEPARKLAADCLRNLGYTVLEARHGFEALHISEQHKGPIHMIVTDVVMPGLNGRTLVQCLMALRPEVKVVYMSGYTDDAVVRYGVVERGVAFVPKPYLPADLAHKVREVLGPAAAQ